MPEIFHVAIDATHRVTAIGYPAGGVGLGATLILAHGAGAGQTTGFLVRLAGALAERGLDVVTFNFLYTEERRQAPDSTSALEACYRAVINAVVSHARYGHRPLFIGGKSMGGRIATHVAAADSDARPSHLKGIVLLGYPLHPPGKPEQLRIRHLPAVRVPMLFVQGSRDPFGAPEELMPVLRSLGPLADLHLVEGGDHSFAVPKRSPVAQEQVFARVQERIIEWIRDRCEARP